MIRAGTRREEGVIAVVVALVLALVLIPVAALAVDLGNGYTLASALDRAADAAARAGAQELVRRQRDGATPAAAMDAARDVAIDVLCSDPVLRPRDSGATGFAAADCSTTGRGWAADDDADPAAPSDPARHPNGEIEFYTGTAAGGSPAFTAAQRAVPGTDQLVTGIRVVTPPATVTYAFAPVFGVTSGVRQAQASAELLTVLPARDFNGTTGRDLRLYLTGLDLAGTDPGLLCARSAPQTSWSTVTRPGGTTCEPAVHPFAPRGHWLFPGDSDAAEVVLHSGLPVDLEPQYWPPASKISDFTAELFGPGGRLNRPGCPAGSLSASSGPYDGLESARLADFVDERVGSVPDFQAALRSADPGQVREGWLDPDVLRCGRLVRIPVLGNLPTPPAPYGLNNLSASAREVTGFRLLWIDDRFSDDDTTTVLAGGTPCLFRGFYWESSAAHGTCTDYLRAITGYVLDPKLLPATVAGADAANTTAYLGSGLPATVRLVRDIGDPPAS